MAKAISSFRNIALTPKHGAYVKKKHLPPDRSRRFLVIRRPLAQTERMPETSVYLNDHRKVSPELSSTPSLSVDTQKVPSSVTARPSTLSTT
ncbi:hypothetical protein SAMN06265370_103212 [Puniceibacterium sediminis]|uniref:Uncharacterized protein n=1 Tax=Puniceibacterium sediminis TaxID=1608407 RepID=A0A238VXR9_9RHOB|nr:hypothetical protein SAMN06265370_103212 [Puniceibacterium sediminis]